MTGLSGTGRHSLFFAMLALATILALAGGRALAKPYWMSGSASNAADFLPPEQAFHLAAHVDGGLLRVRWVIADGYYLYRSRIDVRAESPDLALDAPVLPPGDTVTDAYFGTQTVYRQQVEATVAYHQLDHGAHPIQIRVSYQGCAQAGLCYPLLTEVIFPESGGSLMAQSVTAGPVALGSPAVIDHPTAAAPWNATAERAGAGSSAWEPVAIVGGLLAFLLAGLKLRSVDRRLHPLDPPLDRHLDSPVDNLA